MNNEELKKKIVEIINDGIIHGEDNFGVPTSKTIENIADALIAAGIVDKSDYASMKETAVRYKAEVSKAGARVKEAEAEANRYEMLYKLQNRDMALAERRAHDAEHRAARAERALKEAVDRYIGVDCLCHGADDTECKNCNEYCNIKYLEIEQAAPCAMNKFLQQAEKELAEERKDGNETD